MGSKLFIVLITCFWVAYLSGQAKDEREEKVSLERFPAAAKTLLKDLPQNCKRLKFYRETDGTHQSFEAKFRYQKQYYSIEFNNSGIIEDIEVSIKKKHIPDKTMRLIKRYFSSNFNKFKIIKIQKQYVNKNSEDQTVLLNAALRHKTSKSINYEIIAEVKTKKERYLNELLFNDTGEFLSSRRLKPTSYEHVLY